MGSSRTVLIAGAGIGGLTAALALAASGFRAVIYEQSNRLEETGAGIQLAPNATRILTALGLGDALAGKIVKPEAISVKSAQSGREIVTVPLGREAEFRYGAPYWMIHRADLQAALLAAVSGNPDIVLKLGVRVEDFAPHGNGMTMQVLQGGVRVEERGIALVGADGLWSTLRGRLRKNPAPEFRQRTAWRATLPSTAVAETFRAPVVHLWLGADAHLVHYPVRGGDAINVVAIVHDRWRGQEWSAAGSRDDILARFPERGWAAPALKLLSTPPSWAKWALHDRLPDLRWGDGPMTLLGDAAHPMLPFLAQGAAMAIEDAATLAQCMAVPGANPAEAMRSYEGLRRGRTARVQRAAAMTGKIYHQSGPVAVARDAAMRLMGGERLRARYDWLYDWRST